MRIIQARNVHEALPEAVHLLLREGEHEISRNGSVLALPEPVTTVYAKPQERVIFWPERDANPFFHFYEALWMLGGRRDVASLTRFVKRMTDFSDDGTVFHGAYGYRWRKWFNFDQLIKIVEALRADPTNRRQVLQIWDCRLDLTDQVNKRDLPCNLVVHFQIRFKTLEMTVFCRSNDIIWGTYGANAVHFSMLQEVLASLIGVPIGRYYQISSNWHAYPEVLENVTALASQRKEPPDTGPTNPYADGSAIKPFPMVNTTPAIWFGDLNMFLDEEHNAIGYQDKFFRRVALPILQTHNNFKNLANPDRYQFALEAAKSIKATDWQRAITEWIQRRFDRKLKRSNG